MNSSHAQVFTDGLFTYTASREGTEREGSCSAGACTPVSELSLENRIGWYRLLHHMHVRTDIYNTYSIIQHVPRTRRKQNRPEPKGLTRSIYKMGSLPNALLKHPNNSHDLGDEQCAARLLRSPCKLAPASLHYPRLALSDPRRGHGLDGRC